MAGGRRLLQSPTEPSRSPLPEVPGPIVEATSGMALFALGLLLTGETLKLSLANIPVWNNR